MKRSIILLVLIALPALAGTIYEWKDPETGKLRAGDKPPQGVEYWIEGQRKPGQAPVSIQEQQRQQQTIAEMKKRLLELKCKGGDGLDIGTDMETHQLCFGVHPQQINKTESAYGTREQWVYYGGLYVYFTNGRISAVQRSNR